MTAHHTLNQPLGIKDTILGVMLIAAVVAAIFYLLFLMP